MLTVKFERFTVLRRHQYDLRSPRMEHPSRPLGDPIQSLTLRVAKTFTKLLVVDLSEF